MSDHFEQPKTRKRRKAHPTRLTHPDPSILTPAESLAKLESTLEVRRKVLQVESREYWKEWMEQLDWAHGVLDGPQVDSAKSGPRPVSTSKSPESAADAPQVDRVGQNGTAPSSPVQGGSAVNSPPATEDAYHIICLGIGKITDSREAQYQFIQLESLAERFSTNDVWVFDPMFGQTDIELVKKKGWKLYPKNLMGSHPLPRNKPTIAYLPHCPRELYEAFLAANWAGEGKMFGWEGDGDTATGREREQGEEEEGGEREVWERGARHLILANVFMDYVDNIPAKKLKVESPLLYTIAPHLSSVPLPNLPTSHAAHNAFSSLSWQYLPLEKEGSSDVDWSMKGKIKQGKGEDEKGKEVGRGEMLANDLREVAHKD